MGILYQIKIHSTMLSKVFQGRIKLQYPNHNEEPLQV
jgi:hypothetical protein